MTSRQTQVGARIQALDLDWIAQGLTNPGTGVTPVQASQQVGLYRCFLELLAWYRGELIVPSEAIDQVWRIHNREPGRYAADIPHAVGYVVHRCEFGARGPEDAAVRRDAYARTLALFRRHFGIDLPAGEAGQSVPCEPAPSYPEVRAARRVAIGS